MKKILHITTACFALAAFSHAAAQNVNIPDNNFKNRLLIANTANGFAKDENGTNIQIDSNNDGEIQESEALNVYELYVNQALISDLTGIEAFTNLTLLYCYSNNLTTIDVSNNTNLVDLNCSSNNLTAIDVSSNTNLVDLNCMSNDLTTIDLSNNMNLYSMIIDSNDISSLDFSNNPSIGNFRVLNNPNLSSINLYNGTLLDVGLDQGIWNEMFGFLPDNVYICADEEEVPLIEPILNNWGATGQIITSTCSFLPAGDYNTITGVVRSDWENNGCDDNDLVHFAQVKAEKDGDFIYSYTNDNGEYTYFTNDGTFDLNVEHVNPDWFTITPENHTVVFDAVDGSIAEQDFCITPNGNHPDLEIMVTQLDNAVPGFETSYKIVYRNIGNQLMSQEYGVSFFFNDNLMDFISADIAPNSANAGALSWSYEDLKPFESREIVVNMSINSPTHPDFPVAIDDELSFTVNILPVSGDENTQDNTFVYTQTVVGSYDPNDITCLEGSEVSISYIGEDLHYLVRFENTGTDVAHNIVVVMDINDEYYNPNSLDMIHSSHNADVRLKENTAEMYFNNIMLDTSGHGNILLALETKDTLEENDFVISNADIYFDYNYPIITNDAQTTFLTSLSVIENPENISLNFFPNPTKDKITITAKSTIRQIQFFDMAGKLLKISNVNKNNSIQDVNFLSNGVYLMKIETDDGEVISRLVKE